MKLILTGRIVTMDAARTVLATGAVYVDGNAIVAVQDAQEPVPAGFDAARRIDTHGIVFPGLIELHNHLSYNVLRLWSVPASFKDRGQWQRHPQYVRQVNGPMLKLSQSSDPRVLAAIARFAETKCILGGVTSSQGISLKSDHLQKYYQGALRVVEAPRDADFFKAATHIPDLHAKDWDAFNTELHKAHCLLLHLSEGFDRTALDAFKALQNPATGAWAINEALAGIHCAALGQEEFGVMKTHGGAMVWSPLSNFMLYGQTAKVDLARTRGIPIALGSDWSPSGSKNLLHELKVAKVANDVRRYGFSDADIVSLATSSAAAIVKWNNQVGSLEVGKRADIVVITAPAATDHYSAIIGASELDIQLVLIDGNATVGTPTLMKAIGASGESITVGGALRIVNYGQPDPEIAPIPYTEAVQVLTDALANLPNIPTAPPGLIQAVSARPQRRWTLALDEQHDTGYSLRPMLPFMGQPTGPDVTRVAQAGIVTAPIGPVPLDKASVPDDHQYAANLNGQFNIPQDIKDGLKIYYPV
ncbi:amidohydrolase family protein [Paraburkholderia sp. BL17N1]|uniref:amidohydrolase family protein n=1 Tax=Paraburkholderia sp. BL17N1 TaxID=1938798 RepID=UPI000EB513F7|nr:amidohydrolase family protein [Paraburkholderia sp. BL17N1]RKR31163.1 cytosine/adenosine deaminase-related metal-dependent hydrolase [Paraburkholderia sp. BL17N1]